MFKRFKKFFTKQKQNSNTLIDTPTQQVNPTAPPQLQGYYPPQQLLEGNYNVMNVDLPPPYYDNIHEKVQYNDGYQISKDELEILKMFNIVLVIDNSSSMNIDDRIIQVKEAGFMVAKLACEYDEDGVEVILLNQQQEHIPKIHNASEFNSFINNVEWEGYTPTGKVLQSIVNNYKNEYHKNPHTKPLSIIVFTDGEANNEKEVENAIVDAAKTFQHNPKNQLNPKPSIVFQFFQVGNNTDARKFLEHLDNNITQKYNLPDIVDMVYSEADVKIKDIIYKALIGAIVPKIDKINY